MNKIRRSILFAGILFSTSFCIAQKSAVKGIQSGNYPQEIKSEVLLPGDKVTNIVKLVRQKDRIVAVTKDQIFTYSEKNWTLKRISGNWQTACVDQKGNLWLGAPGLILNSTIGTKIQLPDFSLSDTVMCMMWEDEKTLHVGTNKGLFSWKDSWSLLKETEGKRVRQMVFGANGDCWLATSAGLICRKNNKWLNLNGYLMDQGLTRNFFSISNGATNNDIIFGSTFAISQISSEGNHWNITKENGLPYGPVTTINYSENELWLGTSNGAIKKDGNWHYYHGKRWLPDNQVNDIIRIDPKTVWIATPQGISEIKKVEITLAAKADRFEKRLNERHLHYGLVRDCSFEHPGDTTSFNCFTNDNDGLWTSIYLAAECFRYASTGAKDAYDNAVRTFLAMEKLQTVNPIPGYVARSYVSIDEQTGKGGEWHVSTDGKWKWKSDTSSDEIVGHMFAYPLFYELVAKGEMKERVKTVVNKLMTHIVDHNFQLVDLDGKATRWGVWTPDSLNNSPDWLYEKGINSLQILSFLESAYFVTGDQKYDKAFRTLVNEHHYAENMVQQKMFTPFEINHSDDELAFLPYYALLRYARDPELRKTFHKSLLRSWKVEQPDRNPLWNIIGSFGLNEDCDLKVAVSELQDYPIDIIHWGMQNSQRWDLRANPLTDRFGKPQATTAIPVEERGITKWNSNPYYFDYGGNGSSEDDGAAWLLPYWMGRYHQFIKETTSSNQGK